MYYQIGQVVYGNKKSKRLVDLEYLIMAKNMERLHFDIAYENWYFSYYMLLTLVDGIAMTKKEKFTLDEKEYLVDDLDSDGKAILQSLKFVEQEIAQMQARLAVLNTAKTAYITSIQQQKAIKGK